MNVSQVVARAIEKYGAPHVFTLTGHPQDPLAELCSDGASTVVLARSERSAIAMADGYARYSGRPTFTYVQFGPGVTAAVGGLSDAYWAHSPVISLSSAVSTTQRFRDAYQEIDQQASVAPVTKWYGYALEPTRIPDLMHRALTEAMSGVPGPVHLDLPGNFLQMKEYPGQPTFRDAPQLKELPTFRMAPSSSTIEDAFALILKSKRPIILAGAGVIVSRAWDVLTQFAEQMQIPVTTSMAGKGSIAGNHPLALGVSGVYSRKAANDILGEADLVLAIGTRLGVMTSGDFKFPTKAARLIHIDSDSAALGTNFNAELSILADARISLQMLTEVAHASPKGKHGWADWTQHAQKNVKEWRERYNVLAAQQRVNGEINPRFLLRTLENLVRPDDIVVADTGYSAAWAGVLLEQRGAGNIFFRAAGSLGWAFPAAIGVQLAAGRDRRVICLTGDGGLGYHISDLETAVRTGAPTITVVMNNSSLGFEYVGHKLRHGHVDEALHAFHATDYAAVARAFGAHGERVEDPLELEAAFARAVESKRPALLDVVVSKEVSGPTSRFESYDGARPI